MLVVFRFTDPGELGRAVSRLRDRGYVCREEPGGGVVCRTRLNEIEDITYYLVVDRGDVRGGGGGG
jgi:DNA-binding transcriptional ArsR family regulator